VVHVLTAAAAPPTKAQILAALQGAPPIPALLGYALDARVDFGARLRATRAITEFCPELPNQCRQGILAVLDHAEGGTLIPPQRVLLLRTGIELLADAGSGLAADRMRLLAYLESPHRDVRFAAARALEHLRDPAACEVLRRRDEVEPVSQVKQAIGAAIALADCGG
jgi:HEAT repeat protein